MTEIFTKKYHVISNEQVNKAIKALVKLQNPELTDDELNHIMADTILLDLLPSEIRREYDKIKKWYI